MSEPVLQIPFEDAFRFDPSPTFAELREHRPVARVRTLAGADVWLVTRYDDVRMVSVSCGSRSRTSSCTAYGSRPARA